MVKYKCIKTYPNPHGKKWEIGDVIDGNGTKGTYDDAPNWPEFWQKIE